MFLLIRQPRQGRLIVNFNRGLVAAGGLVALLVAAILMLLQFQDPSQPLEAIQILQEFVALAGHSNSWVRGLGWAAALMGLALGTAGRITLGFTNQRRSPGAGLPDDAA